MSRAVAAASKICVVVRVMSLVFPRARSLSPVIEMFTGQAALMCDNKKNRAGNRAVSHSARIAERSDQSRGQRLLGIGFGAGFLAALEHRTTARAQFVDVLLHAGRDLVLVGDLGGAKM